MATNIQDFFQQMTIRICSSLDIETALQRTFQYLAEHMPVEVIFLHLYDKSLGALRTIAEVTDTHSRSLDIVSPLTKEGRSSFEKPDIENTRIANHPDDDPVVKSVCESLKMPRMTALIIRLMIEGKRIGSLTIATNGGPKYTEDHRRMVSVLNEPLAIAFSNALKYQRGHTAERRVDRKQQRSESEVGPALGPGDHRVRFGIKKIMSMVNKVAALDSPVLLLGETGVGKGVIASAIHRLFTDEMALSSR